MVPFICLRVIFKFKRSDSSLFRIFYIGTKLTRDNTIDGKEPIEVNQVSPTTIVTQDSDITKLRTEKLMENLTFLYLLMIKNSYIISTGAN